MKVDFDKLFNHHPSSSAKSRHQPTGKHFHWENLRLEKQRLQMEVNTNASWKGPSQQSLKILELAKNKPHKEKRFDLKHASFKEMDRAGILPSSNPEQHKLTSIEFQQRKKQILHQFNQDPNPPPPPKKKAIPHQPHSNPPIKTPSKPLQTPAPQKKAPTKYPTPTTKTSTKQLFPEDLSQVEQLYKQLFVKK